MAHPLAEPPLPGSLPGALLSALHKVSLSSSGTQWCRWARSAQQPRMGVEKGSPASTTVVSGQRAGYPAGTALPVSAGAMSEALFWGCSNCLSPQGLSVACSPDSLSFSVSALKSRSLIRTVPCFRLPQGPCRAFTHCSLVFSFSGALICE